MRLRRGRLGVLFRGVVWFYRGFEGGSFWVRRDDFVVLVLFGGV